MNRSFPPISPQRAAASGKCPRCGEGRLFDGYLQLRRECDACGLDFSRADAGDGPAAFAIFLVGFLAVALAFLARFSWGWPMPAAFAVSAAAAIALAGAALRPLKAALVALQYREDAADRRPDEAP